MRGPRKHAWRLLLSCPTECLEDANAVDTAHQVDAPKHLRAFNVPKHCAYFAYQRSVGRQALLCDADKEVLRQEEPLGSRRSLAGEFSCRSATVCHTVHSCRTSRPRTISFSTVLLHRYRRSRPLTCTRPKGHSSAIPFVDCARAWRSYQFHFATAAQLGVGHVCCCEGAVVKLRAGASACAEYREVDL